MNILRTFNTVVFFWVLFKVTIMSLIIMFLTLDLSIKKKKNQKVALILWRKRFDQISGSYVHCEERVLGQIART
jgi:hypothetical protein